MNSILLMLHSILLMVHNVQEIYHAMSANTRKAGCGQGYSRCSTHGTFHLMASLGYKNICSLKSYKIKEKAVTTIARESAAEALDKAPISG